MRRYIMTPGGLERKAFGAIYQVGNHPLSTSQIIENSMLSTHENAAGAQPKIGELIGSSCSASQAGAGVAVARSVGLEGQHINSLFTSYSQRFLAQ